MLTEHDFCRLTAEHVSDIVLVVGSDMVIEFCTFSVRKLLGYEPLEITGKSIREYIHSGDWPETKESLDQAARDPGREFLIQCRAVAKNGDIRTMESLGKAVLDAEGTLWFVVISRDVTASIRASEQMRKLFRAVEQSPAVVIITDNAGNIDYVNPKFSEVTGYTSEEVLGRNPRFLKSGHTSPEEYRRMWHRITRGEEYRGELENRKKDQSTYWASVVMSGVKNEEGKVTHYLSVQEDITEKKNLERQLQQAQQFENIALLAGGVAHDLNNVLVPVMMAAQLLEQHSQDPQSRHLVSMITASGKRATDIVRQVLAFAKGPHQEKAIAPIKHLARNALETLKQIFPKNISFRSSLPPDLLPVRLPPVQCEQILLNLAINARDAMPEGGSLRISACNLTPETLPDKFKPDAKADAYVLLSVEDSGGGIPESIRERIFEPFFTTKGPQKGSGLGLNIVKRILSECGGFIDLRTQVGQGTTFELYLPAVSSTAMETQSEAGPALPMGNQELILLVDDERFIRETAASMLQLNGYRVLTAENGAEALVLIGKHHQEIKLLIADLLMPVLAGEELVRAARRLHPNLKVLILTGSDTHEDSASFARLQADSLLKKPFSAPEFHSTIWNLLQ